MRPTPAPVADVVRRLLGIMLPAGLLLPLTYVDPLLNPFVPPHFDLTGPWAVVAYWLAESGGIVGIPLLGIVMTHLLTCRPGLPDRQSACESLVIAMTLLILLGGGAYLNEQVVKPIFAVPRPNILELAQTPPHAPALGMSVADFYQLPDKSTRSAHLEQVLPAHASLHPLVRDHWLAETGYSFPSSHSFSSMMFATFFLALALTHLTGPRLWLYYLLVLWALAVCLSRPLLRVHSPTDMCVGCLEGILAGVLAFLMVRGILSLLQSGFSPLAAPEGGDSST